MRFHWPERNDIKVYATAHHGKDIVLVSHLFTKSQITSHFVPPMVMHQIDAGSQITIGGCKIDILHQNTAIYVVRVFIDQKFAYSTDVIDMSDDVFDKLTGAICDS